MIKEPRKQLGILGSIGIYSLNIIRSVVFQDLDVIYTSNSVRTLQTAKYFIEKNNMKVHVDDRFDERRVGIPNKDREPDWWLKQFRDENFSTVGGESQKDVRERFTEAFNEVMKEETDLDLE